ncbi:MAG: hypothetical protein WBK77_03205 [Alphaproteobacteria bacterium]
MKLRRATAELKDNPSRAIRVAVPIFPSIEELGEYERGEIDFQPDEVPYTLARYIIGCLIHDKKTRATVLHHISTSCGDYDVAMTFVDRAVALYSDYCLENTGSSLTKESRAELKRLLEETYGSQLAQFLPSVEERPAPCVP